MAPETSMPCLVPNRTNIMTPMHTNNPSLTDIPFIAETAKTQRLNDSPNDSPVVLSRLHTPIGDLLAGATEKGLCLLEYTDTNRVPMQLANLQKRYACQLSAGHSPYFQTLKAQIKTYFSGQAQAFTLPLDIKGTPFQLQVWQALQTIPYGVTWSYQQLAESVQRPKAWRAVGSANRLNPISIIIPCHRVIASNGKLSGYGGGVSRKRELLGHESKHEPK